MENILRNLDPQNILRDLGSTDFLNLLGDGSDLSGGPEDLPTDEDEEILLEQELAEAEGILPTPDTADGGGDEASRDEAAAGSLSLTQDDHTSTESSGENGIPDFRLINEALHSDVKDTRDVDLPSSSRVGKRSISSTSTDGEEKQELRLEKITSGKPLSTHYSLRGNPGVTITRVYKTRTLEKSELNSETTEYENSYDSRSTSTSGRKLRVTAREQRKRMRMEEEALERSASPYSHVPVLESQDQEELVVLKYELNEVVERMKQLKDGLLAKYGVCSATYQIKIETRTRTARVARKRQTSD